MTWNPDNQDKKPMMLTKAEINKFFDECRTTPEALAIKAMALAWLDVQPLLRQVAELSLRESNGVKDSAVYSQHDAAVVVKNVRTFLSAIPTPTEKE